MQCSSNLIAQPGCAASRRERPDFGGLVASLGSPAFGDELIRYLHDLYGADHLFVCQVAGGPPHMLTTLSHDGSRSAQGLCQHYFDDGIWRFDPSMAAGGDASSTRAAVLHLNTEKPETRELREFYMHGQVRERVLVFGAGPEDSFLSLSIVRAGRRGSFSDEQRGRLGLLADVVFPLLAKQQQLRWQREHWSNAVTSLRQIEKCLELAPEKIPRREAQVVARMLYGLTATGIALDLHIGCETVITYRKSFYKRLAISGFRELLLWYLKLYRDVGYKAEDSARRPA